MRITTGAPVRPLGQVAREAGITRRTYRAAIDEGLIEPVTTRVGRGGGQAVTVEDAALIIAVAAAALLLGVAFVTLLRIVRASGATVRPGGVLDLGTVKLH
jgi:hypothetical protein